MMKQFAIEHFLIAVLVYITQSEIVIFETCHHTGFIRNIYITVIIIDCSCNTHSGR